MQSRYGRTLALLTQYGLRPVKARSGVRAFEGRLKTDTGEVPIRFEVEDWDFLHYPRITLLERPVGTPQLLQHVDALGGLCYLAPGSVVLDRFQPDVAIHQCLHAAIDVLNRIARGQGREQDIANEFIAYWTVGQEPAAYPVLVDELEPQAESAMYFLLDQTGQGRRALIAQDIFAAQRIATGVDAERLVKGAFTCLLFKSEKPPGASVDCLPATIKQFFTWVKLWDGDLANAIQHRLGSDKTYLSREGCVLAITTPVGRLGVAFSLDRRHRIGYANTPKHYRHYMHNGGGDAAVLRLRLDEIGPSYIHSRNLEFPSLVGKRLTLIGCGAIGGYLAQALVRLGAGTGKGGLLRLVDVGQLEPDNLGRHALGFPSLYQNKAVALREELIRQFPYLQVEAQWDTPRLNDQFFATDLIIEATGEEALSSLVNASHMAHRLGPVLYVWVKGNGECVQALWSDSSKFGCFQCLRQGIGSNYRQDRFPVLTNPPRTKFRGCSSFTPYAVSAPMSAAALAADMVSDWLKGAVSPRFRTRYLETADAQRIKNQDIAPTNGCPACQQL
ncbi:ThiF family adenylyltransferase [Burkholderia pyrrocinia]|uniref:ThiF family adenylyltransferase n=2 Tax=Burkholderia TaxID=32008 RepID=UPI001FC8E087|nr:ThiF family adenylyltransferase [Burkholderia pyrrocinia]